MENKWEYQVELEGYFDELISICEGRLELVGFCILK